MFISDDLADAVLNALKVQIVHLERPANVTQGLRRQPRLSNSPIDVATYTLFCRSCVIDE